MKKIILIISISVFAAFAIEPVAKKDTEKIRIRNWPIEVKDVPEHLKFKPGAPPQIDPIDFQKAKENLRSMDAKRIENSYIKRIKQFTAIPFSRAEMLASYKAMLVKQLAEVELKNMVKRGATDKEIEAFKMQTDKRVLNTRYEIIKTFGKPEEIKKIEQAIRKFELYRNRKGER